MQEVENEDCIMTIQQLYGYDNYMDITQAFLMIDSNEDKIVTKKEAEKAATFGQADSYDYGDGRVACMHEKIDDTTSCKV